MGGMAPEDVYRLAGVSEPRLSPDGRTVAYVVWRIDSEANEYTSTIWLRAAEGDGEARQFTFGPRRDTMPRWSPDGKALAFVSNRDDDGLQLHVIPVSGGEARKLTGFKDEDVDDVTWSPDGHNIAFSARLRDGAYEEEDEERRAPRRITRLQFKLDNVGWICDRRSHIFVVGADGSGEPHQLTKGEFDHHHPAWSPDGSRVAFSAGRHDNWDVYPATDIYVADVDGGEPSCLTKTDGEATDPAWAPDGSRLAIHYSPGVFDAPRHTQLALLDAAGGEPEILTSSFDRQCRPYPPLRPPLWVGDDVYFCVEDHGNTHLYSIRTDGSRESHRVVGGALGIAGFDKVGDALVYTASTPTTLSELYSGDGARLTNVTGPLAEERELVEPERFTATSEDGSEVEAWIMRPAAFADGNRYPVLVNIHGGPFTQYGNKFFDEFQVYCGAGYVVVYSNPRGSSGYSEEWGRAIRGPDDDGGEGWGTRDYEDIMAVTDAALESYDFCDADNVGVMGGSYGGFMTSWIVGHTARFKAACSERAVNQWLSMYGSSDFGWTFKAYMGSFAHEDVDTWLKTSPWTYATDITTPLLIMHSDNDLRCNIEQAEQLFTTLRLLERKVEFVRWPAEGHELSRSGNPAHRVMRFEILLDWFDRYMK